MNFKFKIGKSPLVFFIQEITSWSRTVESRLHEFSRLVILVKKSSRQLL